VEHDEYMLERFHAHINLEEIDLFRDIGIVENIKIHIKQMRREIVDSLMCLSTEPSDELILI
jgi:hypothetical protein